LQKADLQRRQRNWFFVPHCTFKATGLEIEPNLPFAEWQEIGTTRRNQFLSFDREAAPPKTGGK